MPKRQTNNLKWTADLLKISQGKNSDDKIVTTFEKVRDIKYEDIGITAQEKYLSLQAKTDVVRRIKVRWDKSITEKFNAIQIGDVLYQITRIYTLVDSREMELSLAFVD